jgi:hypothetical protein
MCPRIAGSTPLHKTPDVFSPTPLRWHKLGYKSEALAHMKDGKKQWSFGSQVVSPSLSVEEVNFIALEETVTIKKGREILFQDYR